MVCSIDEPAPHQPAQRQPEQRQPEQRQPEQRQPEQRQPEQRQPELPSRPDPWLAVRRVAEAIDRLEADRWSADSSDLETRIAGIWAMVREIDPWMSQLASRYADPPADPHRNAATQE